MRGHTATIDIAAFRADWATHAPIEAICRRWRITKDQLIRLRKLWHLPPRLDRSKRYKPKHQADPTPEEIAERCAEIQATWTDRTRYERAVVKPKSFTIPVASLGTAADSLQDLEGHLPDCD